MENEGTGNIELNSTSKKCRRNWTENEENTLLSILEELVLAGYKGDNGTFKTGTHEEATKRMTTSIPGIIITVKQVVNKMKRWSIKLNEVVDMMNTSGFGWDDARKCVIVDSEQVLAEYLQKHPKVGNHANKEFKEFKRLQVIFGKDRANGRGAETAVDVLEGLNDDTNNVIESDLELDEEHTSVAPTENHMSNGPNVSRPPLKRQKMLDVANKFIENMDNYMSAARSDILLIVKKMPDPPMARNLGEEVKKLGLSKDEEVDLMIKFSHKPEYEKYFWELNGVQRINFVKKLWDYHNLCIV